MYDVVIVGARCAGSALALLLARAGHKVLMVDRTVFPSDTMSGHYIHQAGVSCLRRWGVLERLQATNTPAQHTMTIDFGPVVLTGQPTPAADGTKFGYAPRRWLFDPLLAAAAVEAGAEFWDGVSVAGPIFEDGRVNGIRGMTRASRSVEVRAHLIVGADGRRSGIAAAVGAEKYHRRPATTCNYYSYWSGFEISHPHLFVRDGQFAVAVPTNNGLTIINMAWPITAFHSVRADLERSFYAALARIPWLADRIPTAARAERFMGTADLEGYFRTAYGPGWALVGDAGYHRDPITAQGMTDAFLHAELLTHAISEGLNGRRPLDATLADYQRLRDNATMPMFDLTCDMALLAPPSPEMKTLIDALQSDTVATQRFMGVIAGTVRLDDFFAPANIERIVGARRAA